MRDDNRTLAIGIAQEAQNSAALKAQATKGLVDFLREQIVDAEWAIARAKAEIEAYRMAIDAIERREGP